MTWPKRGSSAQEKPTNWLGTTKNVKDWNHVPRAHYCYFSSSHCWPDHSLYGAPKVCSNGKMFFLFFWTFRQEFGHIDFIFLNTLFPIILIFPLLINYINEWSRNRKNSMLHSFHKTFCRTRSFSLEHSSLRSSYPKPSRATMTVLCNSYNNIQLEEIILNV
jgi:hypothetical protein